MNDWDIPNDEQGLIRQIEYFDRRAQEGGNMPAAYQQRIQRLYRDLANHRRRMLSGLRARTSAPPDGYRH